MTPSWLGRLLAVGGVVEAMAGLGLLLDPADGASAVFGSGMEGAGVAIARLGGGALLALAIACWIARRTPTAPASLGVGWAYLTYNVLTCIILTRSGEVPPSARLPLLGASLLHGLIGALLLAALLAQARASQLS